jgi:(1->4)-alpha-D-glucan 1-alpha-D-glucosylmutase
VSTEISATYRLQLSPELPFKDATALIPYLVDLGVRCLYLSPCFEARRGSSHGYDVVDFQRVRAELGGREGFDALVDTARRHGASILLDIVPNHMAISGSDNPWWQDVLENGRASAYADFFDLDWDRALAEEGLILPVLGEQYGRMLEAGQIRVARQAERFVVKVTDHTFPVSPDSVSEILAPAADACGCELLGFVAGAFAALPSPLSRRTVERHRRHRDLGVLRRLLASALTQERDAAAAVDAEIARLNADRDRLDAMLVKQPYRLAWWRIAARELSYRRFFDIDQLVALRMEDPRVFTATHGLVLHWLASGAIAGVRVDHIDGLNDPAAYLRKLREAHSPAWIVVEKILEPGETLPEAWPVEGTTGYEFMAKVGGVFIDPAGEAPLSELYTSFTGETLRYKDVLTSAKRLVLARLFGSDLKRLTGLFADLCRHLRQHRDYIADELELVLSEVIVHFPVYRSYVVPGCTPTAHDVRCIGAAIDAARRALAGEVPEELFDLLHDVLLLRIHGYAETELAMRFQQLTGPAMAKGAEDTAFYVYNRFIAQNEVGGDPSVFGTPPEAFHRHCEAALARGARGLLATSTHDTKRGEDVRARLALLSEMPRAWGDAVRRWSEMSDRHRSDGMPDRNDEYLLYQSLVGAWPIDALRAAAFMEKAARESKRHTSWRRPHAAYERAVRGFVEGVLGDDALRADIAAFVAPLVAPGRVTSLAQTLLKLTAPGVPDIYRGAELWDLSLVDPDNRRPADFDVRRRMLADMRRASPESVMARADEGAPKLYTIQRALELRTRRPEVFGASGSYTALYASGERSDHVVAVCRAGAVVAVVPRLVLGLAGEWKDTSIALPEGRFRNHLTGEVLAGGTHAMQQLLARFPVALLEREERG